MWKSIIFIFPRKATRILLLNFSIVVSPRKATRIIMWKPNIVVSPKRRNRSSCGSLAYMIA